MAGQAGAAAEIAACLRAKPAAGGGFSPAAQVPNKSFMKSASSVLNCGGGGDSRRGCAGGAGTSIGVGMAGSGCGMPGNG